MLIKVTVVEADNLVTTLINARYIEYVRDIGERRIIGMHYGAGVDEKPVLEGLGDIMKQMRSTKSIWDFFT